MRHSIQWGIVPFFSLLVILSGGCTRNAPKSPKNIFRYPLLTDPPTLDWSLANENVAFQTLYLLQEGLVKLDSDLHPVPALAEKWELSPDGKTYTFTVRKSAKWSDGVSVTSNDFVYAWHRVLNPENSSQYAYALFDVENAEDFHRGKITDPNLIGIHTDGEHKLIIKIKHPTTHFIYMPTLPIAAPHRKDVIEKHPKNFTEPNFLRTTGPYRLTEWNHYVRLLMEPNPYYYGPRPSIDRVFFYIVKEDSTALKLYEMGELEVALRLPPVELDRVKNLPEYKSQPILRGYYYGFNTELKPFDNPLVRKAFAQALNRREIVSVLKGGKVPTTSWIPHGMPGFERDVGLDFNPKLAQRYLAKAGYSSGRNFPPIKLQFDSQELNKLVAEKILFQWKSVLQIPKIELEAVDWKAHIDTLRHAPPHLWRNGWGADYPDPHNFLDIFSSRSAMNDTRWKNAKFDELIRKGAVEKNQHIRMSLYRKAQKLLLETDTVIIPLFQESIEMLVKPYVENLLIDGMENPRIESARIRRE